MILSDRETRAALARNALRITPDPPAEAWSSTAIDLRLAPELTPWKRLGGGGVESVVCPVSTDYDFEFVRRTHSDPIVIPGSGYVFRAHSFLLGWTIERI